MIWGWDFYNLIIATIVGMGLLACGIMLGRNYWMNLGAINALEILITQGYARYRIVNGQYELIKLDITDKLD